MSEIRETECLMQLNRIENKRFDTIESLNKFLKVNNIDKDGTTETLPEQDNLLTGSFGHDKEDGIYYDFDIWYLTDRKGYMYITETTLHEN